MKKVTVILPTACTNPEGNHLFTRQIMMMLYGGYTEHPGHGGWRPDNIEEPDAEEDNIIYYSLTNDARRDDLIVCLKLLKEKAGQESLLFTIEDIQEATFL